MGWCHTAGIPKRHTRKRMSTATALTAGTSRRVRDTTFAVIDVETTGFDPSSDRVVEVACVLIRGGETIETFSSLINPGVAIPAASQIRANVAKLVALAEGFADDRPLARLSDFVDEIDERRDLEDEEAEAELGGDEVAIMTMHASKGLEWRHVFIANVSPQTFPNTQGSREQTVVRDPRTHALAFCYGVDGKQPLRWILRAEHDETTGARIEREKVIRTEEERLFYVAITRAKHTVWISGSKPRTNPSKFLQKILDHADGRPGCAVFPVQAEETGPRTIPSAESRAAALAGLERLKARLMRQPSLFEPWRGKLSYTAISTFATCPRLARYRYVLRVPDFREVLDVSDTDVDGTAGYAKKIDAATYGNVIHTALEFITNQQIAGHDILITEAVDSAIVACDVDGDAELRGRAIVAVENCVATLSRFAPIAAEEEFDTIIAGAQVGGFIDLITRDAEGAVWIVDYKTGRAPDEAYALQLALYRIAVRAKYPAVRLAILRIAGDEATLVEPATPSDFEVNRKVSEAAAMDRDEARPGVYCETCPYAGRLCPEGAGVILASRQSS
jgi:ATP-dependent exoDNAse (exonuclease V) beta subunit